MKQTKNIQQKLIDVNFLKVQELFMVDLTLIQVNQFYYKKYSQMSLRFPSLPCMSFKYQGGQGSIGSYQQMIVIQDEQINANFEQIQAYFSGFTTNILRDTGIQAEINKYMEEKKYYVKGQD
ncbi:hypothetical protein IMG5_023810 [Ichthyophthirius multifiliis]|uniref:Uncharacterized protein n=1 Tax=Ichthyophthirius multifiliis TaxID=5932 RepID=G0QKZ9_ICHMU|nr:hypothetical protein IMG5_023810 [Ichthyophthirius multifiliis]EGR34103.1 hypothetical protein IMG5_023810 [Ichthyophthirius multifiliis]|eukprot:XP_004039407.1 hypothetical protein IMG5_023810 [Ichthyophthirius multifiliis]